MLNLIARENMAM